MNPPPHRHGATLLIQRLAEHLADDGAPHPVTGALALAVRGRSGVDRAAFAREVALSIETLTLVESGQLPLDDLPPVISERIPLLGVDLDALAPHGAF